MGKKLYTVSIILWYFLSTSISTAQGPVISGDYTDLPFEVFVQEVEKQIPIRFVYLETWMEDVFITAKGDNLDLLEVLSDQLKGTGLNFQYDQENRIFITPGISIVTDLPDYAQEDRMVDTIRRDEQVNGLTQAEKIYMEGRKKGDISTLTIGTVSDLKNQKEAVISGEIINTETGEPLIGATIYIEELSRGSVTDLYGHFTLSIRPGRYTARFNCLGMEELQYNLNVLSEGKLAIEMSNKLYPIDEITVRSDGYDQVRGIEMGFSQISVKSIKEIPVVMGEMDVLKVVQMLPGVQNTGEGSSGMNVRGSAADQNMYLINNIPVYNTSHLFGFFSAFNPDIIRDFSFYKSNLPASYGGKLASVMDISSRQGNNKRYTARGGISPITAHIAVEGPIKKDKSSFVLSGRSTYSDWILTRMEDPDLRASSANFYDLAGGISMRPNEKNLVKVFGYYSFDRFSLASTNRYEYANAGGSLNWRREYSSRLNSNVSAVFSQYSFGHEDNTVPLEAYQHDYRINHNELKSDFDWLPGGKHKIVFGGNLILYDLNRGKVLPYGEESSREHLSLGKESGLEGALHIADKYRISDRIIVYGGLRYSLFSYLGPQSVYLYEPGNPPDPNYITDTLSFSSGQVVKTYSGPELRTAITFLTGSNNSLKLSYNRTRQYLFMLSNTIAISPTHQWKLSDYHIKPPFADQFSLGFYEDLIRQDINLSAEVYYKLLNNIVEYKDGADFISSPTTETEVLQGKQKAYGIELMLKKNTGKLTGWLTYTWSRSIVNVNEKRYPSNYDIPHSVNTVLNYRLNRRFSFSSNIVYHTGRPATYPISVFYLDDRKYIYYSDRNAYRIPDYFRMDLSFNVEGNLKSRKLAHSYWMLSVYNLTGRKNAYSVFFEVDGKNIQGYKMSVFGQPIITLSWNFKFGNYASD
ncbi:carboxypeptidase-like regulatory domain-containing protein [Bacteroidota bacterium]